MEAASAKLSLCASFPIISGIHENNKDNKDKLIQTTKSIPQIIITCTKLNDQ